MKDSLARVRQIVWMAICLLAVVVFVKGMAVWFPALQQVCTSTALECQQRSQLTPAEAESLQAFGYSLSTYAWYNLLTRLLQKILGVGIGLLLFWRKPSDVTAWVASLFLIVGIETSVGTILALSQPVWLMATRVLGYVGALTFFLFFYIFPTGEFAPRWTRWAMTIAALVFFFLGFFPDSPLSINRSSVTAALFGIPLFVSVGAAQILRYRNLSDATARTQTKWIVAAAGAGVAAFLASLAVVLSNAGKPQVFNSYWILVDLGFSLITYLLPIAIAIAILRYHLWDIDVIIRRTLVYAVGDRLACAGLLRQHYPAAATLHWPNRAGVARRGRCLDAGHCSSLQSIAPSGPGLCRPPFLPP